MPNDVIELEQEVRSVNGDKRRVLDQIKMFQQHLQEDETWLKRHPAEAEGHQKTLEELAVLEAYVGELHAQAFALDDILLELLLERELWDTPDLVLATWYIRSKKKPLSCHRQPLSLCQGELSHRSRREIVLVYKRKNGDMGSRPSRKACSGRMRELQKASSDTTLLAGWSLSISGLLARVVPLQAAQQ